MLVAAAFPSSHSSQRADLLLWDSRTVHCNTPAPSQSDFFSLPEEEQREQAAAQPRAAELDPSYAKAHLRKGIATLGMPETQQRSKEAVMALQAALKCRVTPELKKEIEDTLKWAQHRRFEAVDMPENCLIM